MFDTSKSIRLSVVTPVFNAQVDQLRALAASLHAAVAGAAAEWLLIDDHSDRAETLACLDELAREPGVRVLCNPGRKGAAGARNHGAGQAQADLLFFVDADDLLLPGSIKHLLEILAGRPGIRWLVGDFEDFSGPAPDLHAALEEHGQPGTEVENWPDAANRLVFETLVNQGAYIIDKALFAELGGFDPRFTVGEDWYLWMRLAVRRELHHCNCLVMLRRRGHASTMSGPLSATAAIVAPYLAARRDPLFAAQRRLLRWRIYRLYRLLSERNRVLGRRAATTRYALLAAVWAINEPQQWANVWRALSGSELR
ncbi:MAG: glycosyltransferase family 2 protein [Chromatiaceae bacterium]|nr:glycosyltransferase family 2 protein [Chromatiaceae bacterium]